ncbi:MAG: glycosyltransferase [Deltaproteobacteria bacterium]|nr:glycosyltransferase [Candidatus Anaeroferrophillus wilburensis]MBN2888409.1 glycosyltransferase [Deltaproteobacteria bacterium]
MKLGLCMVVKDEANTIGSCLGGIVDQLDDIVVVDTGSTDQTREILVERFGIQPVQFTLDHNRGIFISHARNYAYSLVKTPWILSLDADERIAADGVESIKGLPLSEQTAGYFCSWNTPKGGILIEDYKLFVFRNGLRSTGSRHENMQYDIRHKGMRAEWVSEVKVLHQPEARKAAVKARIYKESLLAVVKDEPDWFRHYWFLGYGYFLSGDWDEAMYYLGIAARSFSREFPVECLNSAMVLAHMYARTGAVDKLEETLSAGLEFHDYVKDDFEVRINFRMKPWLDCAMDNCMAGKLDAIVIYQFSS